MYLRGTAGAVLALAGYHGRYFVGYAVRTPDGWTCIASLGMSWAKFVVRNMDDARVTLRTMSQAKRFDTFLDVDALIAIINKLPLNEQPGILPEHINGLPVKLPKLAG